ncbi:hypothetical protein LCGC14_1076790 [marine sediment metagenome]|uniref:Uncharacterized protein n=1 Tax=marine sediment metagenome TaxID=412755 RepID=A0A0F9N3Z2_9ZZZZ
MEKIKKIEVVYISFEKKVITALWERTDIDLKYVETFIIKFEKRYGSNLFDSFINHLKENLFDITREGINGLIRYYLICNVFYEFERQHNFDFKSFFDDIGNVDYTDPEFRFHPSFFKEFESELDEESIIKLVEDLNWFLEN